jgi:beta-galactosidase
MIESLDAAQSSPQSGATRSMGRSVRIAVTEPPAAGPAPLDMGDAETATDAIQLTTRYVTRDGAPWMPVMGEYHFSRDAPERWERELRKMKAGGVNVLGTYLLWIVHEEIEESIRWDGSRDIRRFVELADSVGLKVLLRIGPWAHGETRNGGFPDWLQALPITHRSNDATYLTHTRRWYAAIEEQVRGLFHSPENPGGPIIGVQVDNELYDNGPHLATLRDLAESVGMRASLWTATGWGGAELPARRVLPVYAGYSDGFWEESDVDWPSFGIMHFTYNTARDDLTVGADLRDAPASVGGEATLGADDPWPFVTCELGGGMAVAYHRRPLVDSDDVAALALTKVGSGSAWQGYYMYHGGTHVAGERTSTQESHATGYPNDMPIRDYDFSAPIGAAGTQRAHFHKLRIQHLALESFGHALAPAPAAIPASRDGSVRWAVRSDGRSGFLFVNNHQPAVAALPALADVQFTVDFVDASVTVPSSPIELASGDYFMWPLRQRMGTIPSLTATAQPVTEISADSGPILLFAAAGGIPVEIQLEGVLASGIRGARITSEADGVITAVPEHAPGVGCEVRVGDTTLVFLDAETAESVWRGRVRGRDTLVLWPGEGWFDADGFVAIRPAGDASVALFPPLDDAAGSAIEAGGTLFRRYGVPAGDQAVTLDVPPFANAPVVEPRRGGSAMRLSAPTDDDFEDAAVIDVPIAPDALELGESVLLEIDWVGDVLRVCIGDRIVADQFWYGRALEIDVTPFRGELTTQPLTLKGFAWAPDSGVHVDSRVRPDVLEPTLAIRSAVLRPHSTTSIR